MRVGIVIPTFNQFDYALRAIESALVKTTSVEPLVIVVDDASPEWNSVYCESVYLPTVENFSKATNAIHMFRFDRNGGLTRSWNYGLEFARAAECDYCCVTNSDVVFSKGWLEPLLESLESFDLVGPLTNAPGSEVKQQVTNYIPDYSASDNQDSIDETARSCRLNAQQAIKTTLNGFCLLAKMPTWTANAYAEHQYFRPINNFNSRGQRNPTPLMTLNEYELQSRWHKAGLRSGCCLRSFVFHYRSVSRGDRHGKGQAYRKT